jgi:hypothetical protein
MAEDPRTPEAPGQPPGAQTEQPASAVAGPPATHDLAEPAGQAGPPDTQGPTIAACQEVIDDCRAQADALFFAWQEAGVAARREFLAGLVRHAEDRALVKEVLAALPAA